MDRHSHLSFVSTGDPDLDATELALVREADAIGEEGVVAYYHKDEEVVIKSDLSWIDRGWTAIQILLACFLVYWFWPWIKAFLT
jgi:hypothetical protein